MENGTCLDCGNKLIFKTAPTLGKLVICPDCGAELEVVWLDPLELDWPFMDEDDEGEDEEAEEVFQDDWD